MSMQSYSSQEAYADAASDYLEKHKVYELFQALMKSLAIHKPKDPLALMIQLLGAPLDQLRIILMGVPGSSKSSQLKTIVKDTQVIPIVLKDLLKEEIDKRSAVGLKAKSFMDKGEVVPDNVLLALVSARLSKQDCVTQGYCLEGFPSTLKQAKLLQQAGILANKVIVLDLPDAKVKKAIVTGMIVGLDKMEDDQADVYIASKTRELNELSEAYADCRCIFNDDTTSSAVAKQIAKYLSIPNPSKAPKRPRRVAILGPRATGKTLLCQKLAGKYGMLHINTTELLKAEVARKTKLSDEISACINMGELVPDDIVTNLVLERLCQDDCRNRGWFLEGFPRTLKQAEGLQKAGISPARVAIIDAPDKTCVDRCTYRRIDTLTGNAYHLITNPPPKGLQKRLLQKPTDTEPVARAAINNYRIGVEAVKEKYTGLMKEFDGTQSANDLVKSIESYMVAPLGINAVEF